MSKIMIVDDDTTTVTLLETLLELDGFDVVIVKMAQHVMSKTEAELPDLIMIDYHLSDGDGVDVIRDLRQHDDPRIANVPILMASGMDMSDEAMAAGANQFLIKPFEPDDLPKIFNELLSG